MFNLWNLFFFFRLDYAVWDLHLRFMPWRNWKKLRCLAVDRYKNSLYYLSTRGFVFGIQVKRGIVRCLRVVVVSVRLMHDRSWEKLPTFSYIIRLASLGVLVLQFVLVQKQISFLNCFVSLGWACQVREELTCRGWQSLHCKAFLLFSRFWMFVSYHGVFTWGWHHDTTHERRHSLWRCCPLLYCREHSCYPFNPSTQLCS